MVPEKGATENAELQQAVAEIVRNYSQQGNLVLPREIADELRRRGLIPEDTGEHQEIEALLEKAMAENPDLRKISGPDGLPRYFSTQYLSETYAKILVRKGHTLLLIAETVRENSAMYPRPVPLDMFEEPPFELKPEEIQAALKMMAGQDEYKDIAFTTTSVGTIYLYSSRYLDHNYASFLAERNEVWLVNNP